MPLNIRMKWVEYLRTRGLVFDAADRDYTGATVLYNIREPVVSMHGWRMKRETLHCISTQGEESCIPVLRLSLRANTDA